MGAKLEVAEEDVADGLVAPQKQPDLLNPVVGQLAEDNDGDKSNC